MKKPVSILAFAATMCMAYIAEGKLNPADAEIYERTCENGGAKWPIYYYGERVKARLRKSRKALRQSMRERHKRGLL